MTQPRRNWDYVAMSDYRADMADAAVQAASIITQMRERAESAERLLAEVILAAGGSVAVYDDRLHHPHRNVTLTTWRNDENMTTIFKAAITDGELVQGGKE